MAESRTLAKQKQQALQRLAWEGIIINEVISTSYEFTILVSDQDVDVAFKVIKDLKSL